MPDDIEQVRRVEMRRGKRPIDVDAIQARRQFLTELKTIWEEGTVEDLEAVMRVYGLSEKNPEWIQTLKTWDAERGRH
jgi:hypothetical protein